ncbi:MAG: hypothetical protein R3C16_09245 [Hyphomonadaceae bacterium]
MNERQRDLFLYIWSRRRTPGQAAVALRGALVGAAGGLAFALIMLSAINTEGGNTWAAQLEQIKQVGMLLVLSVPAFAFLGFILANRVFASQEAMYQAMLRTGAQVPAEKPVMQAADRWPAVAVGVAAAIIAVFIIALFIAYW